MSTRIQAPRHLKTYEKTSLPTSFKSDDIGAIETIPFESRLWVRLAETTEEAIVKLDRTLEIRPYSGRSLLQGEQRWLLRQLLQ